MVEVRHSSTYAEMPIDTVDQRASQPAGQPAAPTPWHGTARTGTVRAPVRTCDDACTSVTYVQHASIRSAQLAMYTVHVHDVWRHVPRTAGIYLHRDMRFLLAHACIVAYIYDDDVHTTQQHTCVLHNLYSTVR